MPTQLEEVGRSGCRHKDIANARQLVEFLSHGNTQIRQAAAEHLLGYSTTSPAVFKTNQLQPITDLKLLIRDYESIAKNALTILVNLSEDAEIRENLIKDDEFVESLLRRVTVCQSYSWWRGAKQD